MDFRIELFRSHHQNIWFHVMNIVICELLYTNKTDNNVQQRLLWDAWSPIHTQYLKTEQYIEDLFNPLS